jgi:hypothetical protein
MAPDLRLRAEVFLRLADQESDPVEAEKLSRIARELVRQAEEAEKGDEAQSGAPPSEERPVTPGMDLPAPTPKKP